jgi:23S rRNA (cytidine1920-2'-O)/16S rRNA (cytidine1409-2'-O)-methyltransferase
VGHGQLDARLRADARVHVLDGCNARYLSSKDLPYEPDLLTMDVSFISVTKVLGAVAACMRSCFDGLILVKPQFEAGRRQVGKKGIVRDPAVHREVLRQTGRFMVEEAGLEVLGLCRSGVAGAGGNREFFFRVGRGRVKGIGLDRLEALIEECVWGGGSDGSEGET